MIDDNERHSPDLSDLIYTLNELRKRLKNLAEQSTPTDDLGFIAYDWCGGNVDDALSIGEKCGAIGLARELCTFLGIDYRAHNTEYNR